MRISTLAEAVGVSAKTLRFYEQRGLLPPPPRTHGGYRDYPSEALPRLRFIRDAQSAGLGLAEIHGILVLRDSGQAPCGRVEALIAEHLARIEARLTELYAARAALHALAQRATDVAPDTCAEADICTILAREAQPPGGAR